MIAKLSREFVLAFRMPNETDKNPNQANKPTIHTTHQLPIDLASKVIVKPANDKMSIQSTTFRTIQQPQMRVVRLPAAGSAGAQIIQTQIVPQNILKPSIPGRSTITVSKSPATYLPRVTATLNTIQGAKGTQIRTPTPPSSVAGISPAFVRTSITPRTSSPNAVLSQGTTTWVSGAGTMQVQMPQQIIRSTMNRTITANIYQQTAGQQNSTISVSTPTSGTSGQPTFVATVLPQRPQGATIVYTSQTQPPYIQGHVQRMNVATAAANARQIRPLQRIPQSGIRVNTSSLSIRPNVPGLAPTTILATQPRNTTGLASSTTISNTIPARIFQVQPTQTTGGSQVIGQNKQILSANVMLPIIVNNRITHSVKNPLQQGILTHVGKIATGSVSSDGTISNSLTNTMTSNTMVASIQSNQSAQSQTAQGGPQGTMYSSQAAQQLTNLGNQGGQIVTVSQQHQQQLMSGQQGSMHQGGNVQTVVPLAMGSRNANIPIKTITVSASSSGSLDSGAVTVHRNLTSNAGNLQATTIVPIAKLVSQQQVVNQQQNISGAQSTGQGTPVYIHTRIPAVSTVASSAQSQVITVSSSNANFSGSGTPTLYYEQASLSTADKSGSSHNEPTYGVSSTSNVRYSSEKMIHSIIASSFQNQSNQGNVTHIQQQSLASNQQSVPIRFSPLVVEGQSGSQNQQATHQIISMGSGNTLQQQQASSSDGTTHVIVPISSQVPTSPRGTGGVLRKQNETTPVKGPKKQAKLKTFQIAEGVQMRVPQRQPISASVAQLTQNVKPVEPKLCSTASSPKTIFSERESPSHVDEWSDGSTTVSIPNSPRSEDEDLDAMIQFNKIGEEFSKFSNKTPVKLGSGTKREASEHQLTPRNKKMKQ